MAEEVVLEKSATSEQQNTQGKECVLGRFITQEEGWKIVEAARGWVGTPYSKVGAGSVKGIGGDCSGTTNKSYIEAGFPYPYQQTSSFRNYASQSHQFREIDPKKTALQAGDILWWPGHMAIYAPFPEGDPRRDTGVMHKGKKMINNMYTAFNDKPNAPPYAPYNIETFRGDKYVVYRYLVIKDSKGCPK